MMFRFKAITCFAVLAVIVLTTASPALAEFESTTGKSQGTIRTFPETTTFEIVESGPAWVCKSTNAEGKVVAEGGWQIQVKSLTQQGKFFYQTATLQGPREQLKIEKWGECTGPLGVHLVLSCTLQVASNGTNPSATFSIYPPGCSFKIGTSENSCAINLQPDGNKELTAVKLANEGVGEVGIGSQVTGITSTLQESKELCKTLGIKGGQKTGKLKTKNNLTTEGQKLV